MTEETPITPLGVIHLPDRSQTPSGLRQGESQRTLLPVRPRPVPQELLSSWLFRLAQANHQKLHSLTRLVLEERQLWNRDTDRVVDESVLSALEQVTGIRVEVLRLHTLGGLKGRAYGSFHSRGVNRWILPLGVYHRTRTLRGLMYCPECLRERPAFLLPWRLSLSVVCPRHGTVLLDACPQCALPVMPHRVDMAASLSKSMPTSRSHTVCFQCGTPLQSAVTVQAPEAVVDWQRTVSEALFGDGWLEVPTVGPVPILEYLEVARVWLTLLTFGRRAERLRAFIGFPETLETGVSGRSFDHLDLPTRLLAVGYLTHLFTAWPGQLVEWSRAARLRRSVLLNDLAHPPVWYLEALRPLEYVNPRRPLTDSMLASMHERGFSAQTLAMLQGYAEGKTLHQLAQEFGVSSSTVRAKVTAIYQKIESEPS